MNFCGRIFTYVALLTFTIEDHALIINIFLRLPKNTIYKILLSSTCTFTPGKISQENCCILTGNISFFWPTKIWSTWKGQGGAGVHRESRGTGSMLLFQGVVAEITILIMANLFLTARCQCIQGQSQSLNKIRISVLKIKKY